MRNGTKWALVGALALSTLGAAPVAATHDDRGDRCDGGDRYSTSAHDRNDLLVFGLTFNQRLVCFQSSDPEDADKVGPIRDLTGDTRLVGIDFRNANGELRSRRRGWHLHHRHLRCLGREGRPADHRALGRALRRRLQSRCGCSASDRRRWPGSAPPVRGPDRRHDRQRRHAQLRGPPGSQSGAGCDRRRLCLIAHTWGTEIQLIVSGLEDGQAYRATFFSEDGTEVPGGTFIGVAGPMVCNLNAAILRPEVTHLRIATEEGVTVLEAEIQSPSA